MGDLKKVYMVLPLAFRFLKVCLSSSSCSICRQQAPQAMFERFSIAVEVAGFALQISSHPDGYRLFWQRYTLDLLARSGGSLVYLVVTRPGISYVVHILSYFVTTPIYVHYTLLLRVLRYLRCTILRGLFCSHQSTLQLQACSDATWTSSPDDRVTVNG